MTADAFPFAYTLHVRYAEIDGQKVAYDSHYLTYLDVAITEYFRSDPKARERMISSFDLETTRPE